MEQHHFKDEPEPESSPTSSLCGTPSSSSSDNSSSNNSQPLWKLCHDRPLVNQVKINEEAAEHSRKYFEGVEKVLNNFRSELQSCDTRLKEIVAIKKRKRDCEVRVGFLGGTGTGKSSLINSLLMMKVLPRSEEVSSTAVPVEVLYNVDDDPAHRFKAVIEGISRAEFTKEVKDLFEDKRLHDMGPDGEDGLPDVEIYQRMCHTIEKIKWLYPSLQKVEDLDKTSARQLLNEPHVQRMLDKKKLLQSNTELAFAKDIKKYIESSKPKEGDKVATSLWPLVKVVRIYIKAEILKNGTILVDLPGSHDTSAARVAVADNYRKNLTASIVCAPAVRAGSDRVAHELLSSVERRNMQLDGLYTSDSLFFVVTKIDELMDYEAYIRDHENLQEANNQDMDRILSKSQRITELQKDLEKRRMKKSKNDDKLKLMKETHEKLVAHVDKILAAVAPSTQKRKRVDDVTAADESRLNEKEKETIGKLRILNDKLSQQDILVQKEGNELYNVTQQKQRHQDDLLHAESRVMKACIQNRAQIHVEAARDEYENARRMMGQQPSEKQLQVFSVSADAFYRLSKGLVEDALRKGFSTKADTGISALRDALIAMTWGIRQENARSFNEDTRSCLTRMKLWSADTSSEYKMLDEEREIVENRFEGEIKKLEKTFSMFHIEKCKEFNGFIVDGIYEDLAEIARISATDANKLVTLDWCMVPWNTHRATNQGSGKWTSSRKVNYDWNQDLASIYLECLVREWTETFHNRVPGLLKTYESQIDKFIADFFESLLISVHDNDIHPAIHEALQSLRENILNLRTMLKNAAAVIFEEVNQASKEAHRSVPDEVFESWESTYIQCGTERGHGLFKRNKKTHRDHVNGNGGEPMYKRAGAAIQTTLNEVLNQMQEKFDASFNNAVTQVREDLKIMLERHSSSNAQTSTGRVSSLAKTRLQQALIPHFEALEKAWGIELEPMRAEVIENTKPEVAADAEESDWDDFNSDDFL